MVLRTLHELGHDERSVQLIESAEAARNLHLQGTNIVLTPQPSRHVADPLRWPVWKKYFAFLNVCLFAFMTTGFISGFSPALFLLSIEFKTDLSKTAGLVTWPLLTSGLGNFVWVPLAEYFGKRPVFVVSSLVLFGSTIWCAVSTSITSLLVSRALAGFGGSSTEALGAAIISDVFYLHERGSKMGIYIIFLYCGNSIGSLVAGFVIQSLGWRWFAWLCAIISGLNFLAIFLLVPETRWNRTMDSEISLDTSASEKEMSQTIEKVEDDNTLIGTRKTFLQDLSLWSGISNESLLSHALRPFLLCAYPAVVWSTVAYSLCLAWQIASNTLSSFIFQAPPFNFSPGINGLINIPAIIGNLIGAFIGGHLTDVYVRHWAKTHDGKFSPEARLVLLIPLALIVPAGLMMFGFGAQEGLHWAVLFVGYGFINVVTGVAAIAMTYVIDSYFEVAAEALLLVNGMKNVAGFAFTHGFVPWTTSAGYETVFGAMAAIFFGWMLMALPLFCFGAKIRDYTTTRLKVITW